MKVELQAGCQFIFKGQGHDMALTSKQSWAL